MKVSSRRKKSLILIASLLAVTTAVVWFAREEHVPSAVSRTAHDSGARVSPSVAPVVPEREPAAPVSATAVPAPLVSSTAPDAFPTATSGGVVPALARVSSDPLPLEDPLDYSTHYILINGHRADPRHLLVKFKSDATAERRETVLRPFALTVKSEFALTPRLVLLTTGETPAPVADADDARKRGDEMVDRIKALMKTGQFEYVEPDYIHTIQAVPSDAAFANGSLWGLRNTGQDGGVAGADIDAVRAWDITTGSTNVIVAVIDTGIRYTHSDLSAQMWRNPGETPGNGVDDDHDGYVDNVFGINALTNSGNPMDDQGHGTHVAGTIGATANGGGQHVGVAWQVRLMACKFLGADGSGSDSNAIKCINFAVSKGARILSNSWGGGDSDQALADAILAARNHGALFIAAAGNGGDDGVGDNNDTVAHYPSSYTTDNIIAVAALDRQDKLAGFSNYGATTVDVGAPGVSIFSTTFDSDTSYGYKSGTSMATPHVSGIAALVLSRFPTLTVSELRQRIISTTVPVTALRNKSVSGGRVNAFNAVNGSPDGVLEVALTPVTGTQLIGGTSVSFFVQVSDVFPVENATVTGVITGRPNVTFANDGATPDATANDHIYSADIAIPLTATSLALQIEVTAPGKSKSTTVYTFPVRLPPSNDNFASRITLTGTSVTTAGSNVGATKEIGEQNHAGFYGGPSVWWSWTAPASGTATIKTDGSAFDTIMGVYTGSVLPTLTRVAEDDDSGTNRTSLVAFDAVAGTTYQIAVDGYDGATGDVSLALSLIATPPPPANDDFASATSISGNNASVTGANLGATKQTGEPNHAGNAGGRSVWWQWTPSASGVATIKTDGSLFNTTLGVYTGTSITALTTVASDDDSGEGSRSLVRFNAVSGTTYRIAVDGSGGASGSIALAVSMVIPPPAPANDLFANRAAITGASTSATGTNVGATKETGEPDHAANSGGKSVWWTWTPPSSGTAVITTAGSAFDTLLGVYTGSSVDSLTSIASNDQDPAGGNTSRVTFPVTAGTAYQIAVDGTNTGLNIASGNITLNVAVATSTPTATNDNFASRISISGPSAVAAGTNVGATKEAGEPRHAGNSGGKSVWWTWTAPADGSVTLKTAGSTFDTLLAVYTGTSVSALTTVAQNDDSTTGMTSLLKFNAVAGTVYQIAVDGFGGASGSILLNLSLGPVLPPPANDNFANRIEITGASASVTAQNGAATRETGEPSHANSAASHSVWWTWTAPQSGYVTFSTAGSDFDTVLAVYTGSSLGSLEEKAANDEAFGTFTSQVKFFATAHTTYAIAVDGYAGDSGDVVLTLDLVPSNNLYFTDFENFTSGPNQLAGTDGWVSTSVSGGLTGIFDGWGDGTKTAWIGRNPTGAAQVWAWRPIDYDPVAAGTPDVRFTVDMKITSSTNGKYDVFYYLVYNIDGQLLCGIAFDNATQHIFRYDGASFEFVGDFQWDKRFTLTLAFNFDRNLWSANLGTLPLFVNKTIAVTGQARTLGDLDVYWQIGQPGSPGDNGMIFDNFRIALATVNDAFASATSVAGSVAHLGGSNQGATKETGEPNHGGNSGGSSVWWKWAAPANGTALVDTRGSNFDTVLGIYTGNSVNSLTVVAANDDEDATRHTSAAAFPVGIGTTYWIAVDGWGGDTGAISLNLNFIAGLIAPAIVTQPQSVSTNAGSSATLVASANGSPAYQWRKDGTDLAGATGSTLSLVNVQPASAGIYTVTATNLAGSVTSRPAIFGLSSSVKLVGLGSEFPDIVHPVTHFVYDQILLAGSAATVTADSNQILRMSYIDLNDDIVQVEFSGAGALSIVLDSASPPALPAKYNQSVNYVKGHAGIVIVGATKDTHMSVFSVGRLVNGNPALYRDGVIYDGLADIAYVAISSADGKFGGLRTSNASYFSTKGFTGVFAPGVEFTGPVFVGDIDAFDNATPVFILGGGSDVRVTGGNLKQTNNRAVQVNGITQLKFTAGTTSHNEPLPAQINQGRLEQNGVDVTAQIVVNPVP
jgi:subtilisin family serine protease